jgi:hypothetical protein
VYIAVDELRLWILKMVKRLPVDRRVWTLEASPERSRFLLRNRTMTKHTLAIAVVGLAMLICGTVSAAPLWTPAEISTELWLDASDDTTITAAGGAVSQWNDKSGNARNAAQATGANQPGYVLAEQNGLNVVRLDGSDFLNLGTGLDWMAGESHVAFVVLKTDTYSNLYGAANGGSGASSLHVGFRDADVYRMNYWGNDYNPDITLNHIAGDYNFVRWSWQTGAAKSIYANAKLEGMSDPTHAGTISAMAGGGRIANIVGQGTWGGDLGELVFLKGDPSQDTIDKVEGYLAWKWGQQANLPSGHTYANAAPIPEPATLIFLAAGLPALLKRKRQSR